MRRCLIWACVVVLAGCTAPVDTARMPQVSGLGGPSNSILYTAWAFASPARIRNDPASAARAVAALDYLGGVLNTDINWSSQAPLIGSEMLHAREAVRQVLGIAPTAPSQEVVNSMVSVSLFLGSGDRAAALQTLSAPIFTLGPERTLAVLTDMPAVRVANIATQHAEGALNGTFCALGCYRSAI
jgi:hypothetical protein